ncbi:hypothetical protein EAF00_006176 [Botryotinia globosa]|nr:hypothetical protein EAF00_006176 [Botryotinia globosa]
MDIFKIIHCQSNVGSNTKAPDIAPESPDANASVLYSQRTFYCHENSQEEIDEWRRNILWHARTITGAILRSPDSGDSKESLNFKILERFQKYFLPQHEHFMRTLDLGGQINLRLIVDVNPYCLEEFPEIIIEVGFERWTLDDDGQPAWKLCRSAFFIQDPGKNDHSNTNFRITIFEPFDQTPSGQKFDPVYRDLCWGRVWKLKRGSPDRSSDKREEDARRLAPIMEASRGLSVPFADDNWYESDFDE